MKLFVTDRAVRRYVERWKTQLGEAQARRELEALVALVEGPLPDKPHWIRSPKEADAWIELADNLVAAVQDRHVTTIFARPGRSKEHRAEKRALKHKRRAHRRWQNKAPKQGSHRRGRYEWA